MSPKSLARLEIGHKSNRMPPIYDGPLALNASVGYKFAEVPKESGHYKFSLIDLEAVA